MKQDSIPDINIEIDPFNGGGYHSKYVTTPDGKKVRVNINVTGDLFKELQKHKFVIHKDNISYKDPHGSTSESVKQLFGVTENYIKSLPLSERIFIWLKTKRGKNKILNKLFTKYLTYQQKKYFFETNIASEEYEHIKALGGHVIMGLDQEGKQIFIPIEKDGDGFKLPAGYRVETFKDGIKVPGFGESKPKAEKYSPPKEPPKEEPSQESKNKYDVNNIVSELPKFEQIFTKAQDMNKDKHTDSTKDLLHPEHFSDLDIINGAHNIKTDIDKLPENWEYPTKDMIITRESVIEQADEINSTVEIVDYNKSQAVDFKSDDTNDLNK